MSIQIHLEKFTGPLDLLLHLIKQDEMDIYSIRIVEITDQYLTIIDQMKQLDLDIAGEFLMMAATLIYIKSKMLLPSNENLNDEEEDPRAELIKRLLEYQRYKDAAESFRALPQLDRDLFTTQFQLTELLDADDENGEVLPGIYQLAEAFHRLLQEQPVETFHEVIRESLSVTDYIDRITTRLVQEKRLIFREIFATTFSHRELIVTFLATLELVKMQLVEIEQVGDFCEIWLTLIASPKQLVSISSEEESFGYG